MSVTRKPNGRWEARVLMGTRRVGRTFDRKADARVWETWMVRRKQLGESAGPGPDVSLAEFVEIYWRLYAVPNLAQSTRDAYKVVWERHLRRALGGRGLREITPKILTRLRSDLTAGGVGDPTVLKAFTMLQSVLSFAVVEERIRFNPAREVRKPTQRRTRRVTPASPETVEALRAQLLSRPRGTGVRDATIVSLLAYAGLRTFSELQALRWGDVGARTLLVHRSSKTQATRTVRLLGPLAADLTQWRLAAGRPRAASVPVFPRADGAPWRKTDWGNWRNRIYAPAATRVGLEGSVPYDLRHAFVSLLIAEGRSVADVARQAGHSPATCSSTYIHLLDDFDPDEPRVSAEDRIRRARTRQAERLTGPVGVTRR